MTPENQKIRDALKFAERIIVSALAHQPENDKKCRDHLQKTCQEADRAIRRAIGMSVDEDVSCCKCGEPIDREDAASSYICRHCGRVITETRK